MTSRKGSAEARVPSPRGPQDRPALLVHELAEAIAKEPVFKVMLARFGRFNSVWYEQRAQWILDEMGDQA